MGASNYVYLEDCEVIAITRYALLILYDGEQYWIPTSQIADPETYSKGDSGITIPITQWIAEQKGMSVE